MGESWGGFRPAESCAPCARSSTSGKNSIPRLKGMTRSSGPYSGSRPGNFHENQSSPFSLSLSLRVRPHVPPDTTDQKPAPSDLSSRTHRFKSHGRATTSPFIEPRSRSPFKVSLLSVGRSLLISKLISKLLSDASRGLVHLVVLDVPFFKFLRKTGKLTLISKLRNSGAEYGKS